MATEPSPIPPARDDASADEEEAFEEALRRTYVFGVAAETLSLFGVGAIVIAFAVMAFVLDFDVRELEELGYLGVFFITFSGAASIVVPMPGLAATAGGGAVLDPVLGVPTPVMVGLVAGFAESLGEFTGYAMGFGGTPAFRKRRIYQLFHRWMRRYGMAAMFALSVIPNILFDLAGIAAGSVQMPIWKFFLSVLAGKMIKSMYIAGAGALIGNLFF